MRLCVIGNSHVGMLRAAVRELGADAPDVTFFAKAGAGLDRATIRGPVIAAEDAGLREAQARFAMPQQVDVSDFDAVILVAGTVSVYSALRLLQSVHVSGWSAGPGPGSDPYGRALVSEPAFVAALADEARAGISHRFATALRRASDVAMFLVPQPYPSARVLESARPQEFGFLRARMRGEGNAIAECLARAIDAAFGEIDGLTVLHQPADTVAHGFTTAPAYTRDAVRVDGATPQFAADVLHVGPAFGTRVLARVAADLGGERRVGTRRNGLRERRA